MFIRSVLLAFSLFLTTNAFAGSTLVIGAVPGMVPPLDMADSDVPRGISADYVNAVAATLGQTPHWRFFRTRAAMLDALARGDIDMATGATGEDHDAPLALSRPYYPVRPVFVEPQQKRAPTHRVAYVDTQTSRSRLRSAYPALEPVAFPNLIAALLAVSFGDADAFVGDMTATAYAITHFDLPNLSITRLAAFNDDSGYRFAFAPQRPPSDAQRERVNDALAALPPNFPLVEHARWITGPLVLRREVPIALTPAETAWVRAHPVVRYSMLSQAAPLMFRDARGQPAGIAVDALDAIARVTGLRFEPRMRASIEQLYGDLKSGESMIVPYSIGDRAPLAGAVLTASMTDGLFAIVTAVTHPQLPDARALAGKRVALPHFRAIEDIVREKAPGVSIVRTRPIDDQFRAVANGRADATVIDLAFANYAVGNPYRGVLTISGVLSTTPTPFRMVVASDEPVLLGILNRAIAALPPPQREAIRSRWKLTAHPEALWERRRPQIALGAALGTAALLMIAFWAISLRVQIVRRVAAEKAMRAARDEAEAANRAKSTFLATMSHEIRTPMNAVLGLLELELRAPGERAATERALTTAHRAARDLLGMIDDLLDIAKIEAERLTLSPAPLELEAWLTSVAAIYEPAARAKGIALIVERTGAGGPAWLLADGQRLRQIVGNLLSNAIKFTDAGAVTLRYGIDATQATQATTQPGPRILTLTVSDTGVGIPPERQAALFTPFVQAHDGSARQFGGTGLGLTICKRLVTMMHGDIELRSEAGRGTRFTVRLSLPEASAPAEAAPIKPAVARDDKLDGQRVLIVDDHPANRIVLDGQLRLLGASTRLAADGRAALAAWRAEPAAFDVILTDCSMPVMSGEDLTRAVRDDESKRPGPPAVPVIGLTANAQPEAAARALASGMTMCLVKPVGLDALRDALLATTPRSSPRMPEPFDAALLDSFGDGSATLIDTLKTANEHDLADARAAMQVRDYTRLRDIAHRMKGAAALIGAKPFVGACVDLQHACERASNDDHGRERIDASFDAFAAAAAALDAALGAPAVR